MPSTEFFGVTMVNNGPLTTTFTAPSSCATQSDFLAFLSAPEDPIGTYSSKTYSIPGHPLGSISCGATYGACYPSGEAWDHWGTSSLAYYSPAFICPDGWTTAGVLQAGPEPTGSGMFGPDAWPASGGYGGTFQQFMFSDYYANILDPSETMAYCCPSGWEANPALGGCSSTLGPASSYSYSQYCQRYITHGTDDRDDGVVYVTSFDGKTWDPPLISDAYSSEDLRTRTIELTETGKMIMPVSTENLYVATVTPGIPMIYQQSDLDKASKGGNESGKGDKDANGVGCRRTAGLIGVILPLVATLVFW